jgi:hypothetical protein
MSTVIAYFLLCILFVAFKISVSEILVLFEIFRNGNLLPGLYSHSTEKVQGNYTVNPVLVGNKKDTTLFIV